MHAANSLMEYMCNWQLIICIPYITGGGGGGGGGGGEGGFPGSAETMLATSLL